ncbi:MAG TPA: AAC(3) family N-acetyltransferase [Methylomirabilota bacterium]|nr:AAC(3) family N-acetyltransferase [Methylomirabilota bacterium]
MSERVSLLERLSGLAVDHLGAGQVSALRGHYHSLRVRLHPLIRAVNGTFGAADLRRELESRLPGPFEVLMVHSSVNHMVPMFMGTPLELLHELMAFCGSSRTLAMPAFYFGGAEDADAVAAFRREPRFDVRRTPSQMGMLTELFRRMKGVRQSLHPTHRVAALGPLATELTEGHDTAPSTFGPGSPFDFMARRDTLIVGLGKPFEILTQVHHAEALLGDEFPVPSEEVAVPVTIRDERGGERPFTLRVRRFARARNMWRLPELMTPGQLHSWTFHRVPLFSVRAAQVTADLIAAARAGRTLYPK